MIWSNTDHFVFYTRSSCDLCVYRIVYVNNIIIIEHDHEKIAQLKRHMFSRFQIKFLCNLKYFFGIEVAQSPNIYICQRNYALDYLEETNMLYCKRIDSLMDTNSKLLPNLGSCMI